MAPSSSGSAQIYIRRSLSVPRGALSIDDRLHRLYVSGPSGTEVLDSGTGEHIGTWPLPVGGPQYWRGMVIDSRRHWGFGSVLTAEGWRLGRVDLQRGVVAAIAEDIPGLGGVAVEPVRGLLVATASNRLLVLDEESLRVTLDVEVLEPSEFGSWGPSALVVDSITGLAYSYFKGPLDPFEGYGVVVDVEDGSIVSRSYEGEFFGAAIDAGHLLITWDLSTLHWGPLRGSASYGGLGVWETDEQKYMGQLLVAFDERNGLVWAENFGLRMVLEVRGHRDVVPVARAVDDGFPRGVVPDGAHRSAWGWTLDPVTLEPRLVELALKAG